MPVMEITYPEGTFDDDARVRLADELTTVLLRAERAPDTEFFRSITWLYVHELPRTHVMAAGRPSDKPIIKLDVTTPQGAMSDRRRKELVADATRAIREIGGIAAEDALTVWVLCHEIPEGSWGAAGQVIEFEKLKAASKAEREQAGAGAAEALEHVQATA